MESDLKELYERFDRYLARLEAEVREATQHLSEGKRKGFQVPRPDFVEFQSIWNSIRGDRALLDRWMQRLKPTGYEDETRAIHSHLQRMYQDKPTREPRCDRGFEDAA